MEKATDIVKSVPNDATGFFKTVFNFDEDSKSEMFNLLQYMVLAIIPCVIILKAVRVLVPEEDESKGTVEIAVEIIAQIAFMAIAMYFSNKAIRYVPTYSGSNYMGGTDMTGFMLAFMVLLLTMQTKIGAKVNILFERVMDLWHGRSEDAVHVKDGKNNVKVSQPLAGRHAPSQADSLDNMRLLPNNPGVTMQVPNTTNIQPQQSPDFNLMYQNQVTSMPGAASPGGGMESFGGMPEPMAANDALGSGGFSSW
jgi:hypothetical protein